MLTQLIDAGAGEAELVGEHSTRDTGGKAGAKISKTLGFELRRQTDRLPF